VTQRESKAERYPDMRWPVSILFSRSVSSTMHNEYALLDSGDAQKLERFGDVIVARPCAQALWAKQRPEIWERSTAQFTKDRGWYTTDDGELPGDWIVSINDIAMRLELTPAGHLGVFPETRALWDWITDALAGPAAA